MIKEYKQNEIKLKMVISYWNDMTYDDNSLKCKQTLDNSLPKGWKD